MENASIQKAVYLVNPDVVLREEDEDGGLLFNPDTNQVKIVNSTGLFIWKQFCCATELEFVLDALQANFEAVPVGEVENDVKEFLEGMLANGFIGLVESE